jgi:hypothetical protein
MGWEGTSNLSRHNRPGCYMLSRVIAAQPNRESLVCPKKLTMGRSTGRLNRALILPPFWRALGD